jgi:hypothetical protein
MTHALTLEHLSPERLQVGDRAKGEPEGRFHTLAPLIDVPALKRAMSASVRARLKVWMG